MDVSAVLDSHPAAQAFATRDKYWKETRQAWTRIPMYSIHAEPAIGPGQVAASVTLHPETKRPISCYDGSYCAVPGGVARRCLFATSRLEYPGSVVAGWKLSRRDCKAVIRWNRRIRFPRVATSCQYWDMAYRWAERSAQTPMRRFLLLHAVSQVTWSREAERRYRRLQIERIQKRFPLVAASYRDTTANPSAFIEPGNAWVWQTVEAMVRTMRWDWLSLGFRTREVDRRLRQAMHRLTMNNASANI